jgi:hypothetical protein
VGDAGGRRQKALRNGTGRSGPPAAVNAQGWSDSGKRIARRGKLVRPLAKSGSLRTGNNCTAVRFSFHYRLTSF